VVVRGRAVVITRESSAAAEKDIFSRGDLAGGQGLWAVTKLGGSGAVAVQQIQSLMYDASVPEFDQTLALVCLLSRYRRNPVKMLPTGGIYTGDIPVPIPGRCQTGPKSY
jgi:hypothetical protein